MKRTTAKTIQSWCLGSMILSPVIYVMMLTCLTPTSFFLMTFLFLAFIFLMVATFYTLERLYPDTLKEWLELRRNCGEGSRGSIWYTKKPKHNIYVLRRILK